MAYVQVVHDRGGPALVRVGDGGVVLGVDVATPSFIAVARADTRRDLDPAGRAPHRRLPDGDGVATRRGPTRS
jgi:hypothetical protein